MEILTPLIEPIFVASLMRRLRPSIVKMKSREDRGHPYLMPH